MTCSADLHCYQQPNTFVHVLGIYCEHHMAWSVVVDQRREEAGEDPVLVAEHRVDLGPFDTADDAYETIMDFLRQLPAFRPGGPGSEPR